MSTSSNSQCSTTIYRNATDCSFDSVQPECPPAIPENYDCIDFYIDKKDPCTKEDDDEETNSVSTKESVASLGQSDFDAEIDPLCETFNLPIDDLKSFVFTETLLISSRGQPDDNDNADCHARIPTLIDVCESVVPVGAICIHVTDEKDSLNGFISAQWSANGGRCIEIMTTVNRALTLTHEKKVDTVCSSIGGGGGGGSDVGMVDKEEKSLLVFQEESHYVGVRKVHRDKYRKKYRGEIKLGPGNLILAGSNLILLRYLTLSQFCGTFHTWSVNMDGEICVSKYCAERTRLMYINKKRHHVIKITRTISRKAVEDVYEIYHYLPSGHLLRYESCFSDYVWHINPLTEIPPRGGTHTTLTADWQNDAQLLSMFLDKKEELRKRYKDALMQQQPQIKSIIRDYVLNLVRNKPHNILDFTLDYFVKLRQELREDTN